jgi:DNA repair exonuclease SbcCD ATPase subunit
VRLLALDLERLGHFTNGRVTLAEPGSPSRLTLVHAPNEAGKTTILEGVRCFLFGFRERSGHLAHDGDQTTLKVRATFELGGHVYEARRRKGKKEQLVGTMIGGGSASIDDEWLRGKLSHPNREVFESVFAFSLDKLAQGAELLKGEQVKRAIYGAGFGGTVSPQRVLDDLRAKRELLFAERGHTRKIHQVAAKLVELEQLTSRATIKRDDELRIETELGAKKAAADERHARVAVLGRDNDRTAALRRSLEPWRSLLAAREELERLVVPPGLGVAEVESHRRAVEEHARNAADHREALEALDDAQSELDQVRLDPTILEASLLVEALYADLNAYRKAAEDHMKRVGELAQLHRGTSERLAGHRPTWTLEDLRTRAIDTRTRSDFNATVTQHETLEQDARRSEADRDRLNASIASLEARERAAPPAVDAAAARAWLADWSGFDSLRERVREAESSVRDLQKKSAITRRHLDLPSRAAAPDVERARVPPLVEVVRFDAELGRARDRVTKLDEQIAAARVEIAACDAELRTIEAAGHAPSEAELALGRARRDDGWRLVLRALANEADPVDTKRFDPERPLPRAYERAVTTADDLVDSMRRRADAVQQRAAKEAQKSRRVDEERTLVAAREQAVVEERALDATYVALWAGCDLVPLPPAAMRSWLAHHAALVEVVQDIDSGNERVSRLQEDANAYVVRGRRALDQDPLQDQRIASPDELRTRADARV